MQKPSKKEGYLNELVSYLKKNIQKGYSKEALKWALINQKYPKNEIEKAFNLVEMEEAKLASMQTRETISVQDYEPVQEQTAVEEDKPFWKKLLGF